MKRYQKFFALWMVNVALIYLAVMIFPDNYALGNSIFTPLQAALFTGFIWNYVLWNVEPTFKNLEINVKSPMAMMLIYLAINFATIWLLARLSFMSGFGVGSYVYVFILALVANFVQYGVWQLTDKKK